MKVASANLMEKNYFFTSEEFALQNPFPRFISMLTIVFW
jgi:hypothetical protein